MPDPLHKLYDSPKKEEKSSSQLRFESLIYKTFMASADSKECLEDLKKKVMMYPSGYPQHDGSVFKYNEGWKNMLREWFLIIERGNKSHE